MKHGLLLALLSLVGLAACSAPSEAAAPSLQDALARDGACFARVYDAAHLASHPQQTVTHFFLGAAGPEWRATETPGHFTVAFGFRLAGHDDLYSGIGICAPNGDALACTVEGDGGAFAVTRNGQGLRIAVERLEVEGPHDFSPDLALADNRVMLLTPAGAGACATP